jgi:hypothetical protein
MMIALCPEVQLEFQPVIEATSRLQKPPFQERCNGLLEKGSRPRITAKRLPLLWFFVMLLEATAKRLDKEM